MEHLCDIQMGGAYTCKIQRKEDPEEAGYGQGSRSAHLSDLNNGLEKKDSVKDAPARSRVSSVEHVL